MVIDTSAVLAILQDEPERRAINEALEAADTRAMSVATLVESSIILESRYGPDGVRDLDLCIAKAQVASTFRKRMSSLRSTEPGVSPQRHS